MDAHPSLHVARVLPESELNRTGCAAPTGLQLVVALEAIQNRSPEVVAGAFGYSPMALDRLVARGDQLVVVISRASADVGLATVEVLAGLLRDLRPEEGRFSDVQVAGALDTESGRAGAFDRQVQAVLQRVFGLRDPVFGQPRFASGRWPDRRLDAPFLIDEKIASAAVTNPLTPGTALPLSAYPHLPIVQRLPWPVESA